MLYAIEPVTAASLDSLLVAFIAFIRRIMYRERFEDFFLNDLRMLDDYD